MGKVQTPSDASMRMPRRNLSKAAIFGVCAALAFESLGTANRRMGCVVLCVIPGMR